MEYVPHATPKNSVHSTPKNPSNTPSFSMAMRGRPDRVDATKARPGSARIRRGTTHAAIKGARKAPYSKANSSNSTVPQGQGRRVGKASKVRNSG